MKDKERGITIPPQLTMTTECRLAAMHESDFGVSRERAAMVEPTQVKQSGQLNPDFDPDILDEMFARGVLGPDVDGDIKNVNGEAVYFNLSQGDVEPFDDFAGDTRVLILGGPRVGGTLVEPTVGGSDVIDGAIADMVNSLTRPVGIDHTEYPTDADGDTALTKSLAKIQEKAEEVGVRVAIVGGPGGHAFGLAAAAAKMSNQIIVIDSMPGRGNTRTRVVHDDIEQLYRNIPIVQEIKRMHEIRPRRKPENNYPTPRRNKKTMHRRK